MTAENLAYTTAIAVSDRTLEDPVTPDHRERKLLGVSGNVQCTNGGRGCNVSVHSKTADSLTFGACVNKRKSDICRCVCVYFRIVLHLCVCIHCLCFLHVHRCLRFFAA